MSTPLLARFDLTPAMKMLLIVLSDRACQDGSLSITLHDLLHNVNLAGQNVLHNLAVLKLTRDLDYEIVRYPEGDLYEIRLRRLAVVV